MGTFEQLTRQEFEAWLDDLGFQGKWQLKPGRGGVYLIRLSPHVGIEINSTTGSRDDVMGRGRASMSLRLVSLVTGRTLNRKAMGQSHFARTLNWRKNWAKGVERMKGAYLKSKSWYDNIAQIEDRDKYKADMLALIESRGDWQRNSFLSDLHKKVSDGGVLTDKQRAAVERNKPAQKERAPRGPSADNLLKDLRALWVVTQGRDPDAHRFVTDLGRKVRSTGGWSAEDGRRVDQLLRRYRRDVTQVKRDDPRLRRASMHFAAQVRPATREETTELKRAVRRLVDHTKMLSVKRIRGKTVDINRYDPFTPEEGVRIAKYLRDNGWVDYYSGARRWPEFLARPHHTATFGNLMKIDMPQDSDSDGLREAVREARAALKTGDWDGALAAVSEAERLLPGLPPAERRQWQVAVRATKNRIMFRD